MLSDHTAPPESPAEEAPTQPVATVADLAPVCPSCGAAVEPEWRHCGACGTALSDLPALPAPPAPAATPGRWRRMFVVEQPALFLGTLIVVLLLAAGAAVVSEKRLDDKQQQLENVRADLRDTEAVLAAARGELGERVKERDALKADLDKTRSSLTDAERSVRAQGSQLETFKNCLTAIEDFALAIDRGDSAAARAASDRADRFCTEALALL